MNKSLNKTMIGLFVVGAVAVLLLAIAFLGSGKYFTEKSTYLMVFEGSVKGLNVGAPVVLRGVRVGSVSDIRMHFDNTTKAITILVYADFEKDKILTVNMDTDLTKKPGNEALHVFMKELIRHGLRAQLEMQNIVTGQLQIALDFYPDKPAAYKEIDTDVPEIPTIPTPLQELTRKLVNLPIEEILINVNSAMDGISKLVQSPELKESISNLDTAMKDMQSLLHNMDAQFKPLSTDLSVTIKDTHKLVQNLNEQVTLLGSDLDKTIVDGQRLIQKTENSVDSISVELIDLIDTATSAAKKVEKVVEQLEIEVKADSGLMYHVTEFLNEVEKLARSLRILTDYLERHPEALLSGKGNAKGD
jgi:paraquat-inducible protein B